MVTSKEMQQEKGKSGIYQKKAVIFALKKLYSPYLGEKRKKILSL